MISDGTYTLYVKAKDKVIEESKLKGKKGYDLFNTIFFERHKEILLRSAKKYSLVIIVGYMILDYLVYTDVNYLLSLNVMLYFKLSWFIIVMFIVNRGAIITQAMFYNCDHAMLTYNFYRESEPEGQPIRHSTLSALGIKMPEKEYMASLRYTREGYSDSISTILSIASKTDFGKGSLLPENTTLHFFSFKNSNSLLNVFINKFIKNSTSLISLLKFSVEKA